jgi:hypothetical protein
MGIEQMKGGYNMNICKSVVIGFLFLLSLFLLSGATKPDYSKFLLEKQILLAKKAVDIIKLFELGDKDALKSRYNGASINERRLIDYLLKRGKCDYKIMQELLDAYNFHKKAIEGMNIEEKKKYLYERVINMENLKDEWKRYGIMTTEAAILHIIEIDDSYKDMIMFLQKKEYIPISESECKNWKGFAYRQIMDIIKSHPKGNKCVSIVSELMNSDIKCVRDEAEETYKWLRSGIIYPYKYSRVIFQPEDVIAPCEIQ